MQSRTACSFALPLLLTLGACAHQEDPSDLPQGNDDGEAGGTALGGGTSKGGGGSGGSVAAGSTNKGGSSSLPPAGTHGGKAGKGGGGSTSVAGGGDSGDAGAGGDGEPVNMPLVGLALTFQPESASDNVDFIGGELNVINDTAQPLALSDLKVRYYFGNEITAVVPSVMMNWAQFGAQTNLGGATCMAR
jgi:endoglucanase